MDFTAILAPFSLLMPQPLQLSSVSQLSISFISLLMLTVLWPVFLALLFLDPKGPHSEWHRGNLPSGPLT